MGLGISPLNLGDNRNADMGLLAVLGRERNVRDGKVLKEKNGITPFVSLGP